MYLKLNTFNEDIPIVILLKAMGAETDQEVIQLVGTDNILIDGILPSIEECAIHKVFTQIQALEYIGSKIKVYKRPNQAYRFTKVDLDI